MNYLTHTPNSADISIFSPEIGKFCYIKKYRYRLRFGTEFLIVLDFLEVIKEDAFGRTYFRDIYSLVLMKSDTKHHGKNLIR